MIRNFQRRLVKAARLLRIPLYRRALLNGTAAAIEHETVLCRLDCAFVVDIGANKGQFALAARRNCPRAGIVAFEPLARPATIFRAIFSGDNAVTLHQAAIGPVQSREQIHVSKRDDSSSLLTATALQEKIFPGTSESGLETVEVAPLPAFLADTDIVRPSLLKLDVQGFELAALEGCADFLGSFDHIYVECSFMELYAGQALADDVIEYLARKDFRLRGFYNLATDAKGRAVQADFFFSRR